MHGPIAVGWFPQVLRLAWEFYGLDFIFPYTTGKATGDRNHSPFSGEACARMCTLSHHDTEKEKLYVQVQPSCCTQAVAT